MPKPIKVYKYSIEGKYLAEYASLNLAGKKNNINYSGIAKCAKGIYQISGGYIWRFYKKKKIKVRLSENIFGQPVMAKKGKRIVEFLSIQEAANFIGCHRSNISQTLHKHYNRKTVFGWIVKKAKTKK